MIMMIMTMILIMIMSIMMIIIMSIMIIIIITIIIIIITITIIITIIIIIIIIAITIIIIIITIIIITSSALLSSLSWSLSLHSRPLRFTLSHRHFNNYRIHTLTEQKAPIKYRRTVSASCGYFESFILKWKCFLNIIGLSRCIAYSISPGLKRPIKFGQRCMQNSYINTYSCMVCSA